MAIDVLLIVPLGVFKPSTGALAPEPSAPTCAHLRLRTKTLMRTSSDDGEMTMTILILHMMIVMMMSTVMMMMLATMVFRNGFRCVPE